MTEGRLETIHNLRPKNWDNRRHWTNWHHLYDCEEDHITRESAPFHDLRAGGQFQYEYSGGGPYAAPIEPHHVNDRSAGDRMDFALGRGTDMGGMGYLPLDTEPGRPVKPSKLPRQTAMFTRNCPLKRGLFSEYPHMLEDNGDTTGPSPRAGVMKAGGPCGYLGGAAEHIPDPYSDKPNRGRIWHFRTGPVKHDYPKWMPQGEPEKKPRKTYGPFRAGKPDHLHIGGDVEWIPDPYDKEPIRNNRHPFRTWHTRTKWSMPVLAPWSTGLATSEARKGAGLDLTENSLPSLKTYHKVNLTQTIGAEAALSSMSSKRRYDGTKSVSVRGGGGQGTW
ncbi:conserved hypothetical protein [Leishmania braziliensis MHOM/BR/75/M2904]|uniref:Uncharacterized protein n=2 Tax=Leishmania braziliensis TaxID=5660 RepID=A4H7Q5_LEIBR|nr:conserved hypothetical protein [Leishmania braziliensis MHOM/BR/75/M2904]KAI5685181.1 hypothetical protein MNV84_01883 [Leishmania braziliensis]CAJ2468986.1 unnamed protein product [Leishmania braziliensis]CAM37570.1 conserved hypothetical protein [Leishmania braziliensis MHOM/BR/75/M2904]SYZ64080.1 hypothetical_protein [Leishmania braziliensis MHOM/BR/75/M2904]